MKPPSPGFHRFAAIGAAVVIVPLARTHALGAQQSPALPPALPPVRIEGKAPPPAGPRSIVGIVVDTADIPVDSIEILIPSLRRQTLSDSAGVFRFTDLRPGTYELRARRLGFAPQIRRVTVDKDQGAQAKFVLLRITQALPTVVSTATRGGLSGVVGDTAFNAIVGADVSVLASDRRTVTDSSGAFALDLKAGKYMVAVNRPGYARKLLSVTVPSDSGRRVVVWMAPCRTSNRDVAVTRALNERLIERRATSAFFTQEDIGRLKYQWLRELVVSGSGMRVSDDCNAIVDGVWRTPVYALGVEEVDAVEVYPPGSLPSANDGRLSRTRPQTSINPANSRGGTATSRVPRGAPTGCPAVFVWTRR